MFERRSLKGKFTTVASQKVKISLFVHETLSISPFDLSTLYTKIRHNKLFQVLCELINFCFKANKGYNIAVVDKYGAKLTKK